VASAASVLLALFSVAAPAALAAVRARASLTDIENDVECVACHEPLAVAQSPEAYSEVDYIKGLIAQGLTKPQIERQLVAQYGLAVLGKPPARGFNLTVYVLPPALVLIGAVGLAFALPRWRRRARAAAAAAPRPAALDPVESEWLDEDLAQHPG
jgi:cytochrome c-type biogenesis protein CcmH